MQLHKRSIAIFGIVFICAALVSSCKKKDKDTDTSEAADHSLAESITSDVVNIGSQASDNNSGNLNAYKTAETTEILNFCATVKRDTIHHIDSVIFNNSTCLDGRTRNGILIFNYSGSTSGAKHYRDPGFNCTVSSVGYTVDGNAVNIINKTISNTTPAGFNPANTNLTWNISSHVQITKASGGTVDFNWNRTKTLLNTSNSNVYHGPAAPISWNLARIGLTGNASGTTAHGTSFVATVISQLVRDFGNCNIGGKHPFIQGELDFTPGTKATRHIDFGNGTCDLDATVTINGVVHHITLP